MVNSIDWSTYEFHCSCLPRLMVSGKGKDEALGETAKAFLREVWIEERLNRKKYDHINKFTQKGTEVESDSIGLAAMVLGETLFKNQETLSNGFITGTPDLNMKALPTVDDIKSSWDIWTFMSTDEKKARSEYYWQIVGYMILTGKREARLIYALVDTPVQLVEQELYKLSFVLPENEVQDARINYVYVDIPEEVRIRVFNFTMDDDSAQKVMLQVQAGRNYLKELDTINKLPQ